MKINNNILIVGSLIIIFLIIYKLNKDCNNQPKNDEYFRNLRKVYGSSGEYDQFIDGIIDIGKFNYREIS